MDEQEYNVSSIYALSMLGRHIVVIDNRLFDVDTFEETTTSVHKITLEGRDISRIFAGTITNSALYRPEALSTPLERERAVNQLISLIEKSPSIRIEFSPNTPWKSYQSVGY